MRPSPPESDVDAVAPVASDAWRRLFHRWFVEYNPLYLLSAALVLAGCFLWSRALVREAGLAASLGGSLVAELYAISLIGGAALLTRIGLRRPAILLAWLCALYQWDTTLHTETCAYLGPIGVWAAIAWFALFATKLYALARALRIHFTRHAVAAAVVAAAGLALGSHVLPSLGAQGAGAAFAVWVFALGSLYRPGGITSDVALDGWGKTVLTRSTHVTWILSGALLGVHVLVYMKDHDLALAAAVLALPLLAVSRVRREATAWATVLVTLALAAVVQPSAFWVIALLAAAALSLRAFVPQFEPVDARTPPPPAPEQPYRGHVSYAPVTDAPHVPATAVVGAERARLLLGAGFAAYLAVWTSRWSGGPWPAHVFALDAGLTLAMLLVVWRARRRAAWVPLAVCYGHFVIQARLVSMPVSDAARGEAAIGLGFALLAGSLFTAWRLHGARVHRREPSG